MAPSAETGNGGRAHLVPAEGAGAGDEERLSGLCVEDVPVQ